MSWLQNLIQTYDNCFGAPQFTLEDALTPIDHIEQQAHIEIVLDGEGNFRRAELVQKEPTLLPATEGSAGRTRKPVAHPLCDKLRYVAADYGNRADHQLYLDALGGWANAADQSKLRAIFRYVQKGKVVADLEHSGILTRSGDGALKARWENGLTPLAKLLSPDPKTGERDQGDALVRWRVEAPGELETTVWKDVGLQKAWADYSATLPSITGLCLATGSTGPLAFNHPKRLRHGGDGAKLISSNDENGYTFRGRFDHSSEAYGLSSCATQKAHNALRWLIRRQGTRASELVIVAWSPGGEPVPPLAEDTATLFANLGLPTPEQEQEQKASPAVYGGDAGQFDGLRLRQKIRGGMAKLTPPKLVVIMALDSATPGRMAIVYYRELRGSEFLQRIETWHNALAWPQNFGKERRFTGAPSPRNIAEAAYGPRIDDKLLKATVERLLPCVIDAAPLPRDLMLSAVARVTNRAGLKHWEFEYALGVACSLVRDIGKDKEYEMALEENRTTRGYLFGRLLAVAEGLESYSLYLSGEGRDTTAERLMQRFSDHPAETWRTIELALRPYMQRLRSRRPASLAFYKDLLDKIKDKFQYDDFTRAGRLDPEFLLGYHCQRAALRRKSDTPEETPEEIASTSV
jgi:CRISPR-associated protein Csd1